MNKLKTPEEWFKQADYDIGTAADMFKTGRYIYTVFMCHLSVEKALKALYTKYLNENPPKTHDLNFLCDKINLELPEVLFDFIDKLNDLSVPTRYPDELETLLNHYQMKKTDEIIRESQELINWLKMK